MLNFQRFDKFCEIMGGNPELASCRDDLWEAGYDTDLGVYGLGSGKLLVRGQKLKQKLKPKPRRPAIGRKRVFAPNSAGGSMGSPPIVFGPRAKHHRGLWGVINGVSLVGAQRQKIPDGPAIHAHVSLNF